MNARLEHVRTRVEHELDSRGVGPAAQRPAATELAPEPTADPRAIVEIGGRTLPVRAQELTEEEARAVIAWR